jgi:hypothetical protein
MEYISLIIYTPFKTKVYANKNQLGPVRRSTCTIRAKLTNEKQK